MAYKRGQEVFRESKPFSYIVFPRYRDIVCDWCLKYVMCENEGILKACIKCKWVHYCDQTCQKEAWNSHHKLECKYLQKQNMPLLVKEHFDGNFQVIQSGHLKLLKTILKLKNSGRDECFQLPNGKKRYFSDLESNADELRNQIEQRNQSRAFYLQYEVFKTWLGDVMPSYTEYIEIIGKWQTNATSMLSMNVFETTHIATGLYLGYSSLDHSCAPNAMWFNVGKVMVVRTMQDVKNLSDIRISYIDVLTKTHERKMILKEKYFFDCKCLRCEDPNSDAKFSSLKCKTCSSWVYECSMICSSCNQKLKLSDEELSIVEKFKNGTLPKFEPTMTIKEIKYILEKYIKIFHVCHEIFKKPEILFEFSKSFLQSLKGSHDYMLLVLEIRKLKLNHHSAHLPQLHCEIGQLNLHISDACFALKLFDKAEFHLKKAEELIKVVYGEDHPWMQKCQRLRMELLISRVELK